MHSMLGLELGYAGEKQGCTLRVLSTQNRVILSSLPTRAWVAWYDSCARIATCTT
jgi:hypothetical protein